MDANGPWARSVWSGSKLYAVKTAYHVPPGASTIDVLCTNGGQVKTINFPPPFPLPDRAPTNQHADVRVVHWSQGNYCMIQAIKPFHVAEASGPLKRKHVADAQ